ncbi:hypothetical protein [Streptomyces sp. KMM 9044]|uniref:hypothetical protein n=1 Tax=Streptomyces sp. KMM 9044 TaxID=2744474 RepID=UPI002150D2A4|nr:hypothetical protein [Streptomyces sp. KMM 9044]WAX79622.1 hypothetical protein HUV60_020055 [Streptomyces sp. KMM 9044]
MISSRDSLSSRSATRLVNSAIWERSSAISSRAAASRRSSSSSHDTIAASKTTSQDTTIRRPRTNGNGARHHQLTEEEPHPPRIASEAFDSALRDGLTEFFECALHRDHRKRFPDLKEMQRAWQRVFAGPRLDDVTVSIEDREEWITLNHAWVVNDPGEEQAA